MAAPPLTTSWGNQGGLQGRSPIPPGGASQGSTCTRPTSVPLQCDFYRRARKSISSLSRGRGPWSMDYGWEAGRPLTSSGKAQTSRRAELRRRSPVLPQYPLFRNGKTKLTEPGIWLPDLGQCEHNMNSNHIPTVNLSLSRKLVGDWGGGIKEGTLLIHSAKSARC